MFDSFLRKNWWYISSVINSNNQNVPKYLASNIFWWGKFFGKAYYSYFHITYPSISSTSSFYFIIMQSFYLLTRFLYLLTCLFLVQFTIFFFWVTFRLVWECMFFWYFAVNANYREQVKAHGASWFTRVSNSIFRNITHAIVF